ncbi:MAG: EamA family transporter [Candidatus Dojkabacteria bacterium]|nr:EamA family transporter [Candidatus Dojkabacteria bacterium]
MNWFIYSILSLFSIVGYRITQKKFLTHKNVSPTAFSIMESFWAMLLLLPFVLHFGFEFTGGTKEIVLLIIKSAASGGAALLLNIGLKQITASEYQIINSSNLFITLVTGIVFFSENLSLIKIIACLLVFSAILLVTIRKQKAKLNKYHLLAFASTSIFALVYTADKSLVEYFNNFSFLFLAFIISQITKFALTPRNLSLLPRSALKKEYIPASIITGAFLVGIYVFQYFAYEVGGDLSSVNIIKGTATVFIVILSALLLKDNEILIRKIIASILVSISIIIFKNEG